MNLLLTSRRSDLTRRRKRIKQQRFTCEALEDRQLLSANLVFDTDTGTIRINGSNENDIVTVQNENGMVSVVLDSQGTTIEKTFDEQTVASIYFTGLGGSDRFENSTSISSTARGGSGDDRLTGGSGSDRLYGERGMDILRGGIGDDRLSGSDGADILLGGTGDDSLDGGSGRDILIGGVGGDRLDGGNSGDILVGGTTFHDDSNGRLQRIRSTWNSGREYEDRVASISSSSIVSLIVQDTVSDDGHVDQLEGGSGSDWAFLSGEFDDHHDADYVSFLASIDHIADIEADETISSVIPHADDTSRRNEHFALLGLVSYTDVTHTAVASGDWSDPAVWQNGIVPYDNAKVLIPEEISVEVDHQIDEPIQTVRVDGILSFATDVNSELMVDTMVVTAHGTFRMGTDSQPIANDVTARLLIVDNGQIDRDWDPMELSRGVIIHGNTRIHGAEKTPFVALDGPARRGDKTLTLAEVPSNWSVGDKLVLAGTDRYGKQNEELEIRFILDNAVLLDRPLRYNHIGPRDDLTAHVANLTRNAQIVSENVQDVRGHLMFMHNNSVDVSYAGVYDLGRTDKGVPANDTVLDDQFQIMPETGTNQRGRYGMHFHRAGHDGDHAAEVHGSVITGSRGWGYVNHSSSVEFTSNVAYDVTGAAFVTEAGDEIGRFDGNLSIFSRGSGESTDGRRDIEDFGHQGNGFWFQGGGVSVTNNVAAGHDEDGFIFFTRGLKEGRESRIRFDTDNLVDASIAGGRSTVSVGEVPLREFRNNQSYANETGVATRFHKLGGTHEQVSVIEGLTLWNNRRGLHLPYTNRVIVRDVEIIGMPDDPQGNGITRNSVTRNITYENIIVEGYQTGLQIPLRGENVVVSGRLKNVQNIVIETAVRDRVAHIHDAVQLETPDNLRGKTPLDIALLATIEPHNESVEHLFYDDQIYLHETHQTRRLYFHEQAADFVPFPESQAFVPEEYVGKTNRQLQNEFGNSIAGHIAPSSVVTMDTVFGSIDPSVGDANGDGRFDREDLILVLQAGEYEDDIPGNSTWSQGDWSGDGEFTTADLIFALQGGRFEI